MLTANIPRCLLRSIHTVQRLLQRHRNNRQWGFYSYNQNSQEAQLMLTMGSTRLAVSRGQQTWYHFGSIATFR